VREGEAAGTRDDMYDTATQGSTEATYSVGSSAEATYSMADQLGTGDGMPMNAKFLQLNAGLGKGDEPLYGLATETADDAIYGLADEDAQSLGASSNNSAGDHDIYTLGDADVEALADDLLNTQCDLDEPAMMQGPANHTTHGGAYAVAHEYEYLESAGAVTTPVPRASAPLVAATGTDVLDTVANGHASGPQAFDAAEPPPTPTLRRAEAARVTLSPGYVDEREGGVNHTAATDVDYAEAEPLTTRPFSLASGCTLSSAAGIVMEQDNGTNDEYLESSGGVYMKNGGGAEPRQSVVSLHPATSFGQLNAFNGPLEGQALEDMLAMEADLAVDLEADLEADGGGEAADYLGLGSPKFQANSFSILHDEQNSLRIHSVRRSNPLYSSRRIRRSTETGAEKEC